MFFVLYTYMFQNIFYCHVVQMRRTWKYVLDQKPKLSENNIILKYFNWLHSRKIHMVYLKCALNLNNDQYFTMKSVQYDVCFLAAINIILILCMYMSAFFKFVVYCCCWCEIIHQYIVNMHLTTNYIHISWHVFSVLKKKLSDDDWWYIFVSKLNVFLYLHKMS